MDDADALKLNALKKAYAEVLLNVSKEAAVRVLASEKRGLRLQQELSSAKEEGFQLLLRLNQMFDAKKIETETVSISQQQRIEELEAQLEEAEGIYTALRKDLRKAHSALSKAGTNKPESSKRKSKSINEDFPGEISSLQSRDVGIVVKTQKEPELYKNECTQRIQAFEGNHLSLSGRLDEEKDNMEEEACLGGVVPMDMNPDLISSKYLKAKDLFEVEVLDANCNSLRSEALGSFQIKRKRTNRYKKHRNLWSSRNYVEPEVVPHGNCEEMIKPCTSKMELGTRTSPVLIETESVVQEKLPEQEVTSDMEVVHHQICEDKFKYKFQRRRKKQQQQLLICSDGNFSAEKVLEVETDEQHDCSQEPESVVDLTSGESSRHSIQQLVEVA